jgi:TPR repeat protein
MARTRIVARKTIGGKPPRAEPKVPADAGSARKTFYKAVEHLKKKEYAAAVECYQKGADKGCDDSLYALGVMYRDGKGVEQDYAKAVELFQESKIPAAMCNLGDMYWKGLGVEQDYAKAVELDQKAANKGDSTAMFNLGQAYMYGRGVDKQDYIQAFGEFHRATESGDDGALVMIGYMHSKGYGCDQDLGEAEQWYQKASAIEHPFALWFLIDMYRGNEGRREEVLELYKRVREIQNKLSTEVCYGEMWEKFSEPVEDYFEGQDLADVRKAIADSRKWCEQEFGVVRGPQANKRNASEVQTEVESQASKKKPSFRSGLMGFQFKRTIKVKADGFSYYRCVLESMRHQLQMCKDLNFIEGNGDAEITAIDMLRRNHVEFLDHLRQTEDSEWKVVKVVAEKMIPGQALDSTLEAWKTLMLTPAFELQQEGRREKVVDELVFAITPRLFAAMGFNIDLRIGHWVGASMPSRADDVTVKTIELNYRMDANREGYHYDLILA